MRGVEKQEAMEIFGFDPEHVGMRHRGWWVVEEPDADEVAMGVQAGDLCVCGRDGGGNAIDPGAFCKPNYRASMEDWSDRTYRNYYFAPLVKK